MTTHLIVTVAGAPADDPRLLDELRSALGGDVQPAPIMGGLHEIWRFAVEWGPHAALWLVAAKPTLEVLKVALDVVDKLLALQQRRPGVQIKLPAPDGPIAVSEATRTQSAELIARQLDRAGSAG